ncbi:divalent-cation tolerance protein CutA [Salinisphaera orenii]|uniref:divalent-cation tolerance protein CutA n=1 Tax=Salinisphaera orenii TaxID=856731 RepID=UPI000DBE4302
MSDAESGGRYHPIIIYVTCPDTATAESIANGLVEAGEAACVNIVPGISSVYRWQGQVETAQEVLLLIKTQHTRLEALRTRVTESHPDDVPEIVAVPIVDGLPDYLGWLIETTEA